MAPLCHGQEIHCQHLHKSDVFVNIDSVLITERDFRSMVSLVLILLWSNAFEKQDSSIVATKELIMRLISISL